MTVLKFRVKRGASSNRQPRVLVSLFVGRKDQTLQNAGVLTLAPTEWEELQRHLTSCALSRPTELSEVVIEEATEGAAV